MSTHPVQIMQHRDDRLPFLPPALQQIQQFIGRALVDGGEGLIQQDDIRILQQQPREQGTLKLADGEFGYLPVDDGLKSEGHDRLVNPRSQACRRLSH